MSQSINRDLFFRFSVEEVKAIMAAMQAHWPTQKPPNETPGFRPAWDKLRHSMEALDQPPASDLYERARPIALKIGTAIDDYGLRGKRWRDCRPVIEGASTELLTLHEP